MSPAFMLILAAAPAQPATPALVTFGSSSRSAEARGVGPDVANAACRSQGAKDIVVCAQRSQPYRLDHGVIEAIRRLDTNSRTATATVPPAQAICATQPSGCGNGLESLDLMNVAMVVGTAAVKAATGKDWKKALKTGGPDEYQLYQQAKQRREAEDAERAAVRFRDKARQAEGDTAASSRTAR